MIAKADAVKIAGVIAEQLDYQDGLVGSPAVWNLAVELSLLVEEETDARVTGDVFLSWCKTGPAAIAEVERQLGGAA